MVTFSFDILLCIDSIVVAGLDFVVLTRARVDIVVVMFIAAMVDILMVDILAGKSTDSLLRAGADVLTNVNFNVLASVMAASEVNLSSSSDMVLLSCCASCSCWPTTVSDCDRALQAWKPSDHS